MLLLARFNTEACKNFMKRPNNFIDFMSEAINRLQTANEGKKVAISKKKLGVIFGKIYRRLLDILF